VYIRLGADRYDVKRLLTAIEEEARSTREARRRAERLSSGRANLPLAPVTVDERTVGSEVRQYYAVERYDVEFLFNARGAIDSVSSTVSIRALFPSVRYYFSGHAPDSTNQPQVLRVVAVSGARLERINTSPLGASDMFFRLDRLISPKDAEPHILSYRVELSEDRVADPGIAYFPRLTVLRHRLVARFTPPATPTSLWWFGAQDYYEADRPDGASLILPDKAHLYDYTFDPIMQGWCYGFTWTWPDELVR
jgi:hypothetical protein